MNRQHPHQLSKGPQDTVLPPEPEDLTAALEKALEPSDKKQRCSEIAEIIKKAPAFLDAWARLGENSDDVVAAYSAFRVGYHRGLDKLRANGWRGSGMVRWKYPENRGFLRSLYGLSQAAKAIGEVEESVRCEHFIMQVDPDFMSSEHL